MRLYDRTLARNRGFITKLVEGTPLTIEETDGDVRFLADGQIVGALSQAGRARLDRLRPHGPLTARVHEIYQHYQRNDDGEVVRRWLVLLPTLHAGRRSPR